MGKVVMESCVDSISLALSILAERKAQIRMCSAKKLYKDQDFGKIINCVTSRVCEARRAERARLRLRERIKNHVTIELEKQEASVS